MPSYLSPGVYIEEIESGARPIEAVGTTTAAFVGLAPDATAHVNEAVPVGNWSQFLREFAEEATEGTPLANAVYGFFLNGGSRCYIVNTGTKGVIAGRGKGLDLLAPIDEIAMIAAPGATDPGSYDALLSAAELLGDRVALLDGPERVDDVAQLTQAATVGASDSAAAAPAPAAGRGGGAAATAAAPSRRTPLRSRDSERGYGALYFPWLRVRDAINPEKIV